MRKQHVLIFRLTIPRAGTGPAEANNQTRFLVNDGLSFRINDPIGNHTPERITTSQEREPGRDTDELASPEMARGAPGLPATPPEVAMRRSKV